MPAAFTTSLNTALRRVPIIAIWAVGLIPLAFIIYDLFTGGLGVDPVAALEHRLGNWALYLLMIGLALTPITRLTRVNLHRLRRPVGLLSVTYIALHILAWVGPDMGFLWSQMWKDVLRRPWLTLGMGAALTLLPLALTSNDWSIRKLGGATWRRLHRLVYLAVPLAGFHAAMVGKITRPSQIICLAVIFALLATRGVFALRRSLPRHRLS